MNSAVVAALVELGVEGDGAGLEVLALGMNVRVGEVGGMQGDEVPVGAQVGLEVAHGVAVASDSEGQLRLFAGINLGGRLKLDVVAIGARVQRRCGQRSVSSCPGALSVVPTTYLRPSITKSAIAR